LSLSPQVATSARTSTSRVSTLTSLSQTGEYPASPRRGSESTSISSSISTPSGATGFHGVYVPPERKAARRHSELPSASGRGLTGQPASQPPRSEVASSSFSSSGLNSRSSVGIYDFSKQLSLLNQQEAELNRAQSSMAELGLGGSRPRDFFTQQPNSIGTSSLSGGLSSPWSSTLNFPGTNTARSREPDLYRNPFASDSRSYASSRSEYESGRYF
jgi:hypothetical protein